MAESYKTVGGTAKAEIVVKKSRFIASVFPVVSQDEALARLEETRKKYYDARHNCYAWQIGKKCEFIKYSDDGEPQGTAGIPILDILKGEGITDVLVVVTRYFGGVLLGTGGLVRAYSQAAKEGLSSAGIVTRTKYTAMEITVDYFQHGKVQYLLLKEGHKITDTVFSDKVKITVACIFGKEDALSAAVSESAGGRAVIKTGESFYM